MSTHLEDDRFMTNVREARDNGCEAVCVECGTGLSDGLDMHEPSCSRKDSELVVTTR